MSSSFAADCLHFAIIWPHAAYLVAPVLNSVEKVLMHNTPVNSNAYRKGNHSVLKTSSHMSTFLSGNSFSNSFCNSVIIIKTALQIGKLPFIT